MRIIGQKRRTTGRRVLLAAALIVALYLAGARYGPVREYVERQEKNRCEELERDGKLESEQLPCGKWVLLNYSERVIFPGLVSAKYFNQAGKKAAEETFLCLFGFTFRLSERNSFSTLPTFRHNGRFFRKGNVYATAWRGDLERDFGPYQSLSIGGQEHPYLGIPPLMVKLQDGTVFNLALDAEALASKCDDMSWDSAYTRGLPPDVRPLVDPRRGFWFSLQANKILVFTMRGAGRQIGVPSTGKWYTFPLKEDELVEIFGKPDEIKDFSHYFP